MIYIKYIDQAKETNVTAQSLARSLYRMPVPSWVVLCVHKSSGDLAVVISLKSSAFSFFLQSKGIRDKLFFKVFEVGFADRVIIIDCSQKIIQPYHHLTLDRRSDANLDLAVTLALKFHMVVGT